MQPTEETKQIHPSSLMGTLIKINRDIDPGWLQQRYLNFLLNGSNGFDTELYKIFSKESIITKLIVFIKYNYEYSLIQSIVDKNNWDRALYRSYEPESENQEEVPDISKIINLTKMSNSELNIEIARVLIERILLDYRLHLTTFSREAPILSYLSDELEALNNATATQLSMYISRYRELRSNFGCLEDEINAYNDTEKKMDEIEMDFLENAGSFEISYKELIIAEHKLDWKIKYKKAYPETSEEEIEKKLQIALRKMDKEMNILAELKAQTNEAKLHKAYEQSFLKSSYTASSDTGTRSDNYLRMLKSESRRESKRTIKMAHPDILNNHEYFDSLSEKQKSEIEKLRNEELERLEKIDKYSSKMSSEYYMQLIEKSKEAQNKIDRILKFSGIPVNPDFIIEGNTLEARIDDIESRMQRIDLKIFEWKTKRANLPKDEEKKRRVKIMENNGLNEYISSLKIHTGSLKRRVEELEQAYNNVGYEKKFKMKLSEYEKKYGVEISRDLINPLLQLTRHFVGDKSVVTSALNTLQTACINCRDSNNPKVEIDHLISALALSTEIDKRTIYTYYLK
jgi:predicted transposase YbfD/YdcC